MSSAIRFFVLHAIYFKLSTRVGVTKNMTLGSKIILCTP